MATSAQVTKAKAATVTKPAAAKAAAAKPAAKKAAAKPVAKKADAMAAIVASAPVAAAVQAAAAKPVKARTVRPAQTPVAKGASVVAKAAPILAIKFRVIDGARPVAGRHLAAHTQAVIEVLKLDTVAYPREVLTKVFGERAISYHLNTKGNFEKTADGIKLSVTGLNFFNARKAESHFDPQDVEAYKAMFKTGEPDGRLVKNNAMLASMK